jgi:enolase
MVGQIKNVYAREILDSRGNPTLEVELKLSSGAWGRASVPSGASTGVKEALEMRDHDPARYNGQGVLTPVAHVNLCIAKNIVGQSFENQAAVDQALITLDGTSNKSRLGANAILGVSMAYAHADAAFKKQPLYQSLSADGLYSLPVPMMNIINGGAHANNNLDVQEFMIVPVGLPCFSEALRCGVEIFHALKSRRAEQGLSTAVGDEGGFAPDLASHEAAFDLILAAISSAGYEPGRDVMLAIDVASSEWYQSGVYQLPSSGRSCSAAQWIDQLHAWCDQYPLISIEDGLSENDWSGWVSLTQALGDRVQLVGDDLFVTNPPILSQGIERGAANALLVKLNQIGTVTETMKAIAMAQAADYGVVISHRSGETADTTIADLSVATHAGQIKTGSLCRTDRIEKYNQLLRIEEHLGDQAVYAGRQAFRRLF